METDCRSIEAIVSIDSRGQLVLPKDVREKARIEPGEKFAVILKESEGDPCCIVLVKSSALIPYLKGFI